MEVGSSQKHLAFLFFSGVAIEPPGELAFFPRPAAAPVTSFAINEDRKQVDFFWHFRKSRPRA